MEAGGYKMLSVYQSTGNSINIKKRYWRLVSNFMKLRNFQSIMKPRNDDAHGYVISPHSVIECVDSYIRRGVSVARSD